MDDKNIPQAQPPPTPAKSQYYVRIAVIALAIIVILAGAYLAVGRSGQKNSGSSPAKPTEKGLYNQSVSGASTFMLDGLKSGAGMQFANPSQYKQAYLSADKTDVAFSDTLIKNKQRVYLGAVLATTSTISGSSDGLAAAYQKAFSSPSSPEYKNQITDLTNYLSARMSSLYKVSVANPKSFATDSVKSGAWILDFSATQIPEAPAVGSAANAPATVKNPQLEDYKGQLVLAVSKSTVYYLAAYNTTYNWDNNQAQFSKVLNSLQIDK